MCNALHHFSGCRCGFGGEGHLGKGGGRSGGRSLGPGWWRSSGNGGFNSSCMSELAQSLGYAILFPVLCKFCGKHIYLFASPNGGFAIFDDVGKPWPKHHCQGVVRTSEVGCSFPRSPLTNYVFPVPDSALGPSEQVKPGERISGIVVEMREVPQPEGLQWEIDLYHAGRDGSDRIPRGCNLGDAWEREHAHLYHTDPDRLFRVRVDKKLRWGGFVTGIAAPLPGGGTTLQDLAQYLPPGERQDESTVKLLLGYLDSFPLELVIDNYKDHEYTDHCTVKLGVGETVNDKGQSRPAYASFHLHRQCQSFAALIASFRQMNDHCIAVNWPKEDWPKEDGPFILLPLPSIYTSSELANMLERLRAAATAGNQADGSLMGNLLTGVATSVKPATTRTWSVPCGITKDGSGKYTLANANFRAVEKRNIEELVSYLESTPLQPNGEPIMFRLSVPKIDFPFLPGRDRNVYTGAGLAKVIRDMVALSDSWARVPDLLDYLRSSEKDKREYTGAELAKVIRDIDALTDKVSFRDLVRELWLTLLRSIGAAGLLKVRHANIVNGRVSISNSGESNPIDFAGDVEEASGRTTNNEGRPVAADRGNADAGLHIEDEESGT